VTKVPAALEEFEKVNAPVRLRKLKEGGYLGSNLKDPIHPLPPPRQTNEYMTLYAPPGQKYEQHSHT